MGWFGDLLPGEGAGGGEEVPASRLSVIEGRKEI